MAPRNSDVRDAFVRARDFTFITGSRGFWLASTTVWCTRRLHTPHKKRGPMSFVVGGFGGAAAVRKWSATVQLIIVVAVFRPFLCGTRPCRNGILQFVPDGFCAGTTVFTLFRDAVARYYNL